MDRDYASFAIARSNVEIVKGEFEALSEGDVESDEVGELVVVPFTLHARGRTTGIEASQPGAQVWELRGDQAIRLSLFAELEGAMGFARESAADP